MSGFYRQRGCGGMHRPILATMRPGSIKIHPMHGVAPRIGS
ncbi:hypothetical protein BSU04_14520 [Caballeronia sordidicola]|uniref:Uncharacterized protein n=1 Tax=Caballeronia sordidicola TaxID=196367 RepID=A0A226X4H7_CABSO|nr:hypothetical protein BSU04_14520 [Caballeronia sordidicola]